MAQRGRQKEKSSKLRMNASIRAPQVRVIDENGGMLGIFNSSQALEIAEDRGLDLIEVAPDANPPTCRIMDYGRYLYEQKKKAQEAKKKQAVVSVKEIQIRPRTDKHDFDVKLKHAKRFLEEGSKLKVNLRFKGREMMHQVKGIEMIQKVIDELGEAVVVEVEPKLEGRQMFAILAPDPAYLRELAKKKKTQEKESDQTN